MVAKSRLQRSRPSIRSISNTHESIAVAAQPSTGLVIPRNLPLPARHRKGPPHAKKQENPRAPKPRNAFILFRCYLDDLNLLPDWIPFTASHIQVSRIAGHVWSSLSSSDREIFHRLVEEERKEHAKNYSDYKYEPPSTKPPSTPAVRSTSNRPYTDEEIACIKIADIIVQGVQGEELVEWIQDIITELCPALSTPKTTAKSTSPFPRKSRSSVSKRRIGKGTPVSLKAAPKPPRPGLSSVSAISVDQEVEVSEVTSSGVEGSPPPSDTSSCLPTMESANSASVDSGSSRASSPFYSIPDDPVPMKVQNTAPFNGFDDVTIPPLEYGEDIHMFNGATTGEYNLTSHWDCSIGNFANEWTYVPFTSKLGSLSRASSEAPPQGLTQEDIATTIGEEWIEYLNIPQIIGAQAF